MEKLSREERGALARQAARIEAVKAFIEQILEADRQAPRKQRHTADTARAKKAYEDFFALWKDADPDVPILIQARKEYSALSR